MKPYIHAQSSARRYGGKPEDYEEIHNFLDSSKAAFPDNRHRALTHNAWFIGQILERVHFSNSGEMTADNRFPYIINSDGKKVFVRDIGEMHVLEDYKNRFIPSAADFLNELEYKDWMQNGMDIPPSHVKIEKRRKEKRKPAEEPSFDGTNIEQITIPTLEPMRPPRPFIGGETID
jgi:hypothetical protein